MPVVGSTTLQPGEEATLIIAEHPETEPHLFEINMATNNPAEPEKKIYLRLEYAAAE